MYTQVGTYLSRYTSGKVPKAFKIIPSLRNWEEVLFVTEPEKWTAQAMFVVRSLPRSLENPCLFPLTPFPMCLFSLFSPVSPLSLTVTHRIVGDAPVCRRSK